jgi:hypothetical protein
MPNYTFREVMQDGSDGPEVRTVTLRMDEYDDFVSCNPGWRRVYDVRSGLPVIDPVRLGRKKPDEGFREVLRGIQKRHPLSRGVNAF